MKACSTTAIEADLHDVTTSEGGQETLKRKLIRLEVTVFWKQKLRLTLKKWRRGPEEMAMK
jgi:hypothetical protein